MPTEPRTPGSHLSSSLAQRIVDELAPVIQENLNVMDTQGFIIASSDVSRVGTLHPGAREAAETNAAVSVYSDTARSGERPGVNLPLEYRGRVIGVVGVTGKPAKVRSLAPVLVLTIALLFEREAELAGESRRDAADRDLLARLVFGSRPQDALALLSQRGPALAGPWLLAACAAPKREDGTLESGAVTRLRNGLGAGGVVGALRGVLWVLVGLAAGQAGGSGSRARQTAGQTVRAEGRAGRAGGRAESGSDIAMRIAEQLPGACLVYSGVCADIDGLAREAGNLAVLSTRPALWAREGVRPANALLLHLAAAQLPTAISASLGGVLSGVTSAERETLAAYLATGVAAELSRSGYTHRNTVRRRLQSIAARTGFDVRVPEQAAVLALALAVEEERAQRDSAMVQSAPD